MTKLLHVRILRGSPRQFAQKASTSMIEKSSRNGAARLVQMAYPVEEMFPGVTSRVQQCSLAGHDVRALKLKSVPSARLVLVPAILNSTASTKEILPAKIITNPVTKPTRAISVAPARLGSVISQETYLVSAIGALNLAPIPQWLPWACCSLLSPLVCTSA